MTDEHPNERLVAPSEDGEGFDRSLVSRRSMLGGSALLAGLLAYTSDPTDPQLPGRASGSAAGIARASDNPDEPLIILGPESDPVGYLFQDTAGGIILQDATSGNHFWYNESHGRWETDAELDVPSLTAGSIGNDGSAISVTDDIDLTEGKEFQNNNDSKNRIVQQAPTLADNAKTTIFPNIATGNLVGTVVVTSTSAGQTAIYRVTGGVNTVESLHSDSTFTTTSANDGTTNVFHDGSNYVIENKEGGERTYQITYIQ